MNGHWVDDYSFWGMIETVIAIGLVILFMFVPVLIIASVMRICGAVRARKEKQKQAWENVLW